MHACGHIHAQTHIHMHTTPQTDRHTHVYVTESAKTRHNSRFHYFKKYHFKVFKRLQLATDGPRQCLLTTIIIHNLLYIHTTNLQNNYMMA